MPELTRRDPDQLAATLTSWLETQLPHGASPEVTEVVAPESSGFSNETILTRATWTEDGTRSEHRLVFRVHPTAHTLFPDADFSVQYKVMRALSDAGVPVPLPPLGVFEEDPSWLGVPFFSMTHVDGLIPADNLPYTLDPEGWVLKATDEQRATLWWSGLAAMAEIHKTDWRALDLAWLVKPGTGTPGLDQQLRYYRSFLDTASGGRPQPTAEKVWTWLVDNRPEETGDVVLSWGDARIGNMIWQDFTPAAVLDWEMATLAYPEMDLGWWIYFDRQFSEGLGISRLGGIPGREETVARYSELIGRPIGDTFYYEVFAGFRFAVIMCRLSDLLMGSGVLPGDSDMGTNNIATQFLATLLDLPSPLDEAAQSN